MTDHPKMVVVTEAESNNYNRILTLLGMEKEGDPVTAIEKLMAQPVQEPVAWRIWSPDGTNVYQYTEDGDGEPLYLAPVAQPVQEPATGSIKPCPFCGSVAIDFREGSTFRWIAAGCDQCGATCGEVRVQTSGEGNPELWAQKAKQDAIKEWNTREAQPVQEPRQVSLMRDALNKIASWGEGAVVDSSFDEPCAAEIARVALAMVGKDGGTA